jgi:hypothetical protein
VAHRHGANKLRAKALRCKVGPAEHSLLQIVESWVQTAEHAILDKLDHPYDTLEQTLDWGRGPFLQHVEPGAGGSPGSWVRKELMDNSLNYAFDTVSKIPGTPCNQFVATALRHNGINDFFRKDGEAFSANEMADRLKAKQFQGWLPVGNADMAREYANRGFNVIAVWKNNLPADQDAKYNGHGHVCLIIPNEEKKEVPHVANVALGGAKYGRNKRDMRITQAFGAAIRGQVLMYYHQ